MDRALIDPYQRSIDYMRVSITDLCNLRCLYCRPPEGVELISHDEILRYEEILAITRVACDLGIRKIRVTGGEPLVRRDVLGFISRLTGMDGIEDVGLTTNGILLASMAQDLRSAGLSRLNVSLDSLRRETFKAITGSDNLDGVLKGIRAALNAGFHPVKINVVLLQGLNEEDVPAFARLTQEQPVDVRFIERMPFGGPQLTGSPEPFSARKVLEIIATEVGPMEPLERSPLGRSSDDVHLAWSPREAGHHRSHHRSLLRHVQQAEIDSPRHIAAVSPGDPGNRHQRPAPAGSSS